MRKVFGGFLGLAALFFLGLAYTQMVHAEEPECDSALAAKIVELVNQDKTGVLKLQLRLATLKLAAVTSESHSKTIEGHIAKQEKLFDALMADGNNIQSTLITLYKKYGEKGDEQVIADRFGATLEKFENGDYRKLSTRLKNLDLSAFTLAHHLAFQEKSPFTPADTAVLWFQSEISDGVEKTSRRGSAVANSQEVSSQVLRLTGNVAGVDGMSPGQMKEAIQKTESEISAELDRIVTLYRDDLSKSCSVLANCKDCKLGDENKGNGLAEAMVLIRNKAQEDPVWLKSRVDRVIQSIRNSGIDLQTAPGQIVKIAPAVVIPANRVEASSDRPVRRQAVKKIIVDEQQAAIPTPVFQSPVLSLPVVTSPVVINGMMIRPLEGEMSQKDLGQAISQEKYDSLVYISSKDMKRLHRKDSSAVDTGSISLGTLQIGDCLATISLSIGSDDNYSNLFVLEKPKKSPKMVRLNPPKEGAEIQSAMNMAQIGANNSHVKRYCSPSAK